METGKPSKEQLDYYFKTSRKYFDSLAVKYLQEDKKYYDNYIAPFYNNPFKRAGRPAGVKLFIYFTAILMFSMAVLAFVVLSRAGVSFKDVFDFKDEPDETEVMTTYETTTEKKVVPNTNSETQIDTLAVSYLKTDFEKGAYYYGRKNYEQAEYYLNKIDKKDEDYIPAKEVLKRMRNDKEKALRKKPIEKIK